MDRDRLIKNFLEMVQIDSESGEEANFALDLKKRLEKLGFLVRFDHTEKETGSNTGNLYARREGLSDKETLIFSCHMDTVVPGKGIVPILRGDRITSDGSTILGSDDKSGIAAILEAIESLLPEETGPIELIFSVMEEKGLMGARHAKKEWLLGDKIFILDSSGTPGKAILKAPAQSTLRAKIQGVAAHAGLAPETGISAISVMSDAIHRMKLLRIDEETTANVGTIKGGMATNIVAEFCEAVLEVRSHNDEKREKQIASMEKALRDSCEEAGATLHLQVEENYPRLELSEHSEIAQLFVRACQKLGIEAQFESTGGGSDANFWSRKGFQTIVLAIGMAQVHRTDEFILVEDLLRISEIVKELFLLA